MWSWHEAEWPLHLGFALFYGLKSIFLLIYSSHTSKHCSDDAYQHICQIFVIKTVLCVGLISYASKLTVTGLKHTLNTRLGMISHKCQITSRPINYYSFLILSGIIKKIRAAGLSIYLYIIIIIYIAL